ncbi:MAG: hypothetical protein KDD46_08465 [Bdellovibrionales bacterium]|nr:hypothetical protein [Bdellovibrionales bacterium]
MNTTPYILAQSIDVKIEPAPKKFMQAAKKHHATIEKSWEQACQKNPSIFNGVIFSLLDYQLEKNKLSIRTFQTNYKNYIAQKLGTPLDIKPLSVNGVVVYHDSGAWMIFIGKRSNSVYAKPNLFEMIPAGTIDERAVRNGQLDYNITVLDELIEETSISHQDIMHHQGFCLVWDPNDDVFDIGVEITLKHMPENIHSPSKEYSSIISKPLIETLALFENDPHTVKSSKYLLQAWCQKHGFDKE